MLRISMPPATISGPSGRIWTTRPKAGISGLVAVLQVPASKTSEAVRQPDFVVALDGGGDHLVTVDTRGHVVFYHLRQNRYMVLDKVGSAGTAALVHGPRQVFVAFADATIRSYDPSKGTMRGILKEHRSPVRHLEVNDQLGELLSTSLDGVLVWSVNNLRRKRVLGSGPYGALKASYTPDGQALVTAFKDGSFYIWAAGNFALLRSFTLPVAPSLRPSQTTFSLSPDGQLLVAAGPQLPLLLVYSLLTGELLHGVGLPGQPSPLDASTAAQAGAAGMGADGNSGGDDRPEASSHPSSWDAPRGLPLAAVLPLAQGVLQLRFLSDSATVAALLSDGSVAFVDVLACSVVGAVPYHFPNRRDCTFSLDERAEHLAMTSNGKVLLYELAAATTSISPPIPLPRVSPSQLDEVAQLVASEHTRQQQLQALRQTDADEGVGHCGGEDLQQPAATRPQGGPGAAQQQDAARMAGKVAAARQADDDVGGPGRRDTPLGRDARAAAAREGRGPAPGGAQALHAGEQRGVAASRGGAAGAARKAAGVRVQGAVSKASPSKRGKGKAKGASVDAAVAAAALDEVRSNPMASMLNRERLTALLEAFGEYPSKYRLVIWDFLLQLPHNATAFATLAGMGLHPAFRELEAKLPLANRALAQRLAATLSQLARWCPVFAESSFLPDLAFPFVKLFATSTVGGSTSAGMDERCFETLATLLAGGWLKGWFERFPHPPLGLLTRLRDLVAFHDAPLAAHFGTFRSGMAGVVWPHLATLWTELITRDDWLKLWDHCITAGPDFLYHFIASYLISLRGQLLGLDTDHKLATWLAGPPPIEMDKVVRTAYMLRGRTPVEMCPVPPTWEPLPSGVTYTEFQDFPEGAVELFAQERSRIRDAEEAIMRRRAVVAELELRTRAVSLQTASLSTERQQLAALEEQRRAMLRQIEAETAAELSRLDDKAKEEKLKQVAAAEKAYQANMLEARSAWQRELEAVRAEVAHKRALAAMQIRSREEEEQIKVLEFNAQQRMWALEEDVRRAAVVSAVRDELAATQTELAAKEKVKKQEWEADEEARRIQLQAETARRLEVAAAAEEAAARNAAAREVLQLQLTVEETLVKAEAQRRLRRLTEDQALLTSEAKAAEEARAVALAAAEQEAVRMRAKADLAWYEAEQVRREQMLEAERQQLETAAAAARQKLAETESNTRQLSAQAELLDKRRQLERQNMLEEAEVRRLVEAMAAERGKDVALMAQLAAREREVKSQLDYAARVGTLQREAGAMGWRAAAGPGAGAAGAREGGAAAALRAALEDAQRRKLAELRRSHAEALAALEREREGQPPEVVARLAAELKSRQAEVVRYAQEEYERRKNQLSQELLGRLLDPAGGAGLSEPSSGSSSTTTSSSSIEVSSSSSSRGGSGPQRGGSGGGAVESSAATTVTLAQDVAEQLPAAAAAAAPAPHRPPQQGQQQGDQQQHEHPAMAALRAAAARVDDTPTRSIPLSDATPPSTISSYPDTNPSPPHFSTGPSHPPYGRAAAGLGAALQPQLPTAGQGPYAEPDGGGGRPSLAALWAEPRAPHPEAYGPAASRTAAAAAVGAAPLSSAPDQTPAAAAAAAAAAGGARDDEYRRRVLFTPTTDELFRGPNPLPSSSPHMSQPSPGMSSLPGTQPSPAPSTTDLDASTDFASSLPLRSSALDRLGGAAAVAAAAVDRAARTTAQTLPPPRLGGGEGYAAGSSAAYSQAPRSAAESSQYSSQYDSPYGSAGGGTSELSSGFASTEPSPGYVSLRAPGGVPAAAGGDRASVPPAVGAAAAYTSGETSHTTSTSTGDSRSSLQQSGLMGLSQPLSSPPAAAPAAATVAPAHAPAHPHITTTAAPAAAAAAAAATPATSYASYSPAPSALPAANPRQYPPVQRSYGSYPSPHSSSHPSSSTTRSSAGLGSYSSSSSSDPRAATHAAGAQAGARPAHLGALSGLHPAALAAHGADVGAQAAGQQGGGGAARPGGRSVGSGAAELSLGLPSPPASSTASGGVGGYGGSSSGSAPSARGGYGGAGGAAGGTYSSGASSSLSHYSSATGSSAAGSAAGPDAAARARAPAAAAPGAAARLRLPSGELGAGTGAADVEDSPAPALAAGGGPAGGIGPAGGFGRASGPSPDVEELLRRLHLAGSGAGAGAGGYAGRGDGAAAGAARSLGVGDAAASTLTTPAGAATEASPGSPMARVRALAASPYGGGSSAAGGAGGGAATSDWGLSPLGTLNTPPSSGSSPPGAYALTPGAYSGAALVGNTLDSTNTTGGLGSMLRRLGIDDLDSDLGGTATLTETDDGR